MAKKAYKNKGRKPNQIRVSQVFGIPPGAEEEFAVTGDDWEVDDGYGIDLSGSDVEDGFVSDVDDGIVTEEYIEPLDTPGQFAVIEQRLRRAPGGNFVIDIVVLVEDDVDGALNYEMQITKAD